VGRSESELTHPVSKPSCATVQLQNNFSINQILSVQRKVMANSSLQISLLTFKTKDKAQAAVDANFGVRTTQQGTIWKNRHVTDSFFKKLNKHEGEKFTGQRSFFKHNREDHRSPANCQWAVPAMEIGVIQSSNRP